MVESIGVDSIKELSHRNPASLTKMIAERHGNVYRSLREAGCWLDRGSEVAPEVGSADESGDRGRDCNPLTSGCAEQLG